MMQGTFFSVSLLSSQLFKHQIKKNVGTEQHCSNTVKKLIKQKNSSAKTRVK